MKKNKKKNNYLNYSLLIIGAMIIVLLCYSLFFPKKDSSFYFKDTNIKLKIGESKMISYELTDPNTVIEWSSSNNNVIVNNGNITAKDYGVAIITGTINKDGRIITDTCKVTTHSGDVGVEVSSIYVEEGYLLMRPNSEFNIPFVVNPRNAYVESIKYYITNENVISIVGDKIFAKNEGESGLSVVINGKITNQLLIKVSNDVIANSFVKKVDSITFNEDEIEMEMGESRSISYVTNPVNGYIDNIEWTSSDENIVSVYDGELIAINTGEAEIKVVINNNVYGSINVKVKASFADIKVDYYPKTSIRIGDKTTIKAYVEPLGINETITYKSSNQNIASVNNGVVTGISAGSSVITLSISNGKTKTYVVNVIPSNGSFTGASNLWGYKSLNAKTPVFADKLFFQQLAQKGIGTLQGNKYIINSGISFTYDISTYMLYVKGKSIKVKILYPAGEDLSTLNTLTFMGGRGETNFGGMFADFKNNPSLAKSAGIIALIAEGNNTSFDGDSGAYTTQFVKAITKQQAGVKNSIMGFSDGAHKVLHASKKEEYNSIVIFSGYTEIESLDNAKNSEVFFIIATRDGNYSQAQTAIRHMKDSGYKNVTIITNGTNMAKKFSDKYLVINAGSLMKNGHLSENILLSGMIEYLND